MNMLKAIPYLPVNDIYKAVLFYEEKLGFHCTFQKPGFAKLIHGAVEIHLWESCDTRWKLRSLFLFLKPVMSGSESFIAGTSGCRIEVDAIDAIYEEYRHKKILDDSNTNIEYTAWSTKEFPVQDSCGNLLTFFQRI